MNRPCRRFLLPVAVVLCLVWAWPALAATVHLTGPVGADVRIDGQRVGMLPMAAVDLPLGVHEIECRAHGYEPLSQTLLVPENDAVIHVRLRPNQLRRSRAVTGSALYAGLGQWYSGARWRGWLYFTGESVGLLTALGGELGRLNSKDEYTNAIRNYELAVDPAQIENWREQADLAYQDVADMQDVRNMGLMIAAGSWALSLLDAWLLFPAVDVGPGAVPPAASLSSVETAMPQGMHAAVKLAF